MPPRDSKPAEPEASSRRRSLGEACRELGIDAHGQRCPGCPLKVLCMTETRWHVRRTPPHRYLI
jgi:hypothetical protein